jgi:hypothetical protein
MLETVGVFKKGTGQLLAGPLRRQATRALGQESLKII